MGLGNTYANPLDRTTAISDSSIGFTIDELAMALEKGRIRDWSLVSMDPNLEVLKEDLKLRWSAQDEKNELGLEIAPVSSVIDLFSLPHLLRTEMLTTFYSLHFIRFLRPVFDQPIFLTESTAPLFPKLDIKKFKPYSDQSKSKWLVYSYYFFPEILSGMSSAENIKLKDPVEFYLVKFDKDFSPPNPSTEDHSKEVYIRNSGHFSGMRAGYQANAELQTLLINKDAAKVSNHELNEKFDQAFIMAEPRARISFWLNQLSLSVGSSSNDHQKVYESIRKFEYLMRRFELPFYPELFKCLDGHDDFKHYFKRVYHIGSEREYLESLQTDRERFAYLVAYLHRYVTFESDMVWNKEIDWTLKKAVEILKSSSVDQLDIRSYVYFFIFMSKMTLSENPIELFLDNASDANFVYTFLVCFKDFLAGKLSESESSSFYLNTRGSFPFAPINIRPYYRHFLKYLAIDTDINSEVLVLVKSEIDEVEQKMLDRNGFPNFTYTRYEELIKRVLNGARIDDSPTANSDEPSKERKSKKKKKKKKKTGGTSSSVFKVKAEERTPEAAARIDLEPSFGAVASSSSRSSRPIVEDASGVPDQAESKNEITGVSELSNGNQPQSEEHEEVRGQLYLKVSSMATDEERGTLDSSTLMRILDEFIQQRSDQDKKSEDFSWNIARNLYKKWSKTGKVLKVSRKLFRSLKPELKQRQNEQLRQIEFRYSIRDLQVEVQKQRDQFKDQISEEVWNNALDALRKNPKQGSKIRKLSNKKGYRIKLKKKLRIRYEIFGSEVEITRIGPRKKAYNR